MSVCSITRERARDCVCERDEHQHRGYGRHVVHRVCERDTLHPKCKPLECVPRVSACWDQLADKVSSLAYYGSFACTRLAWHVYTRSRRSEARELWSAACSLQGSICYSSVQAHHASVGCAGSGSVDSKPRIAPAVTTVPFLLLPAVEAVVVVALLVPAPPAALEALVPIMMPVICLCAAK